MKRREPGYNDWEMAALSPVRSRKITVNERVERILQGTLQIDEARAHVAVAERDGSLNRAHQLSSLYSTSLEDPFLKSRTKAAALHARAADTETVVTPIESSKGSPVKHRVIPPIVLTTAAGDPNRLLGDHHHHHHDHSHALPPTSPVKRCLSHQMLQAQRELEQASPPRAATPEELQRSPVQPKPWYQGYSSHYSMPAGTIDAKTRRYGAFGTSKLRASETVAGTAPTFELHASQSLDSIAFKNEPSAWSPQLNGSPCLWPEDTTYGHDSPLPTKMIRCPLPDHRFPTHAVGLDAQADAHLERTKAVHLQDTRELERSLEQEKELRRQEIVFNAAKLADWQARLHFEPLSSKLGHPFVKVKATRAKALTIVQTPGYSPLMRFSDQVEKLSTTKFTLRWRNMAILLDVMRRTPCRRPVLQDIEKLLAMACEIGFRNAHAWDLSRQQFVDLMLKEYPLMQRRHLNRLFSSYDVSMDDRMDMRVLLGTVRALRVQQGSLLEILCNALVDLDSTKRHVVSSCDHLQTALSLCCSTDQEEQTMAILAQQLWKHMVQEYRPAKGLDPDDEDQANGKASKDTPVLHPGELPIKYVRYMLKHDKKTLRFFSELVLQRREDCFNGSIPMSR